MNLKLFKVDVSQKKFRSLEVKLPIWTHEKQGWEEAEKKVRKKKRGRKGTQVRKKVARSRNMAFVQ